MVSQLRYLGNPVRSLQTILRAISFRHPVVPRLIPSGVFDEATLEAVMIFQREFFPPVTGRVDQRVWNALAEAYQRALADLAPPLLCSVFPSRSYTIPPGSQSPQVNMLQSMFLGLSAILSQVRPCPVTGVMDDGSVENVRWLQRLEGRPETGIMDRTSWDTLCRLYAVFVTAAQAPRLSRRELLARSDPAQPVQTIPSASD